MHKKLQKELFMEEKLGDNQFGSKKNKETYILVNNIVERMRIGKYTSMCEFVNLGII